LKDGRKSGIKDPTGPVPMPLRKKTTFRRELSPRALVAAYASGAFPMPDPEDARRLLWFCPDPRGLLPLDERFHVPRRLGRTLRQGRFVCTADEAFGAVMRACAERKEGTWITPDFLAAYGRLHELGIAHSVEAWESGKVGQGPPAGGVYGLALGAAFFAESMFHRVTDAGKAALVHLVERLRRSGFRLCDVQWLTPHLQRFGAYEVPRDEYLSLLTSALAAKAAGQWRSPPGQPAGRRCPRQNRRKFIQPT
jgi:leucyl/phenylalanyl-tRNA--protein transferase